MSDVTGIKALSLKTGDSTPDGSAELNILREILPHRD